MFLVTNENMGLCLYMNDGTSLKSVRQIRRTEYPEYNLGNTRTAKLIIYLALLVKHHKCFQFPYIFHFSSKTDYNVVKSLSTQNNKNSRGWGRQSVRLAVLYSIVRKRQKENQE